MNELRVIPIEGLPEVSEGTNLGEVIAERAELQDGDVVVISQKIVSKAEGMVRRLSDVQPSERANELGKRLGKEPELVALILSESRELLREERVLITETHHGFVCANSGIDSSNLPEDGTVCLLPSDPDASARTIRNEIKSLSQGAGVSSSGHSTSSHRRDVSGGGHPRPPAIVIADSFGRAWRQGQTEVAIGCAGLAPLDDWRGRTDSNGRELTATAIAIADQVAAAADLVRAKDSGVPAVLVRGLDRYVTAEDGPGAAVLRRPPAEDLFR
ncbi:MAG TPA: coenzyme F420-0:L-glutamate ligase [Solirubrobacterales bacterium]|jgi:coenzyme F420-0:L-glutamate ligase/coenzyme F420-1:gamma-L-glutamate ligase|nr:coenzyme F420-0:L-glutamate ligase [Solirubrobacterales bacterium]